MPDRPGFLSSALAAAPTLLLPLAAGAAVTAAKPGPVSPATSARALPRAVHARVTHVNSMANPHPHHLLFENKILPGMTGYGLTVMRGTKIQKFKVTVIDVIKNFQPQMNALLVRCSGLGLTHSGIIEGMSGSPVYINHKLVGAIAFGWDRSKDPIGGVQPIRQMLRIPIPKRKLAAVGGTDFRWRLGRSGRPGIWRACALKRPGWATLVKAISGQSPPDRPTMPAAYGATPMAGTQRTHQWWRRGRVPGLQPLASPLMVSSASPYVMHFLSRAFAGSDLQPVAAGAAGQAAPLGGMKLLKKGSLKLEPGAALAVPLLTGDMDASAIGTVTDVVHGHVYAFGHSFFAQGPVNLPIATSYIYTILPDLKSSFKIGTSYHVKGTLLTDEKTGIVGGLGLKPVRVPVVVAIRNPSGTLNRNFHYWLYPSSHTTPEMATAAVAASLSAQRKLPHNYTVHVTGTLAFGGERLRINQRDSSGAFDPKVTMLPVAMLTDNPFKDLPLKGIHLRIMVNPVNTGAQITSVNLRRTVLAPGDTIRAFVHLRPFNGKGRVVPLKLKVPKNTPDGQYQLSVGAASQQLALDAVAYPDRFTPENVHELARAVKRVLSYKNDRLYARLLLLQHGTATSHAELPNLPMSRVAMVQANAPSDAYPLFNSVAVSVPAGAVVESGGQGFTITVARHADRRFAAPPAAGQNQPAFQIILGGGMP